MTNLQIKVHRETWPIDGVFRISRGSRREIEVIVVELHDGVHTGYGECIPSIRYNETIDSVITLLQQLTPVLTASFNHTELAAHLSAGAARNALDCALWDLMAKRAGRPVWELAGLAQPKSLTTAFTLSIDTPEQMAIAATNQAKRPLLKLKLAGDGLDQQRVTAVRDNAPQAEIIVDANEAWQRPDYETLVPAFKQLAVAMIEQPFKAADDQILADLSRPIPVCADESCHDRTDLPRLQGLYDMINIKLDKTGGLSEALALRQAALAQGFDVMVGCMLGTSLAMAPALLVAQKARFVDLDGPLLLARDRVPGLTINGSEIKPAVSALWG